MSDKFDKNERVYLLPPTEGQSSIEGRVLSDTDPVLVVVDRWAYGNSTSDRIIQVPRERVAKDRRRVNG